LILRKDEVNRILFETDTTIVKIHDQIGRQVLKVQALIFKDLRQSIFDVYLIRRSMIVIGQGYAVVRDQVMTLEDSVLHDFSILKIAMSPRDFPMELLEQKEVFIENDKGQTSDFRLKRTDVAQIDSFIDHNFQNST
jgi:hypothetical protein